MKQYGGISELTTISGERGVFSTALIAPIIAAATSLTVSGVPVVTGTLTVRESDGFPSIGGVHTIVVTTGTLSGIGNGAAQIATGGGAGGGITVHGDLTGLLDDDHPQYLLTDGTRTYTGNQSLGGFNLTSIDTVTASTITGTTGQFGGTVSAQVGSFSHSLTISGTPVLTTTVSGFPIHVDKLSRKDLGRSRIAQSTTGSNSFVVHSCTVPGGLLGTDGIINTRIAGWWFNNSTQSKSIAVAVHFGNQVLYADTTTTRASDTTEIKALLLDLFICNAGSISLQFLDGHFRIDNNSEATTSGLGNITSINEFSDSRIVGSGTVNTAVAQTLEVRFTHANNNLGTTSLTWFERTSAYSYLL